VSPRDTLDTSPRVSDAIRKTTCYMCACRCGIDVHIRDGRVSHIEGNRDHPVNRACSAPRARRGS
jgi:sulfite dehydrogenase (quinone) subunit SoeA